MNRLKKLKWLVLPIITTFMIQASQIIAQTVACSSSQVELSGQCIECSKHPDAAQSIQCDSCDFGKYLLTLPTASGALGTPLTGNAAENRLSMCLDRCEDFAYNYVSNFENHKCEYCGPTCTLCSPKHGCLTDYSQDTAFRVIPGSQYPANTFPFSPTPPNSSFNTVQRCQNDVCDPIAILNGNIQPSNQYVDIAECVPCDGVPVNSSSSPQCQTCANYFSVTNCALYSPTDLSQCVECIADHYLFENTCSLCSEEKGFTQSRGCAKCSTYGCDRCLKGFQEILDQFGQRTCSPCDLTAFNQQYELEVDRCVQCASQDPTQCKYCEKGFLGSISNPLSCELKCDSGQYPTITYADEAGQLNKVGTQCLQCSSPCKTCNGPNVQSQCTSCNSGYYLSILNPRANEGACLVQKSSLPTSGQINIVVSNQGLLIPKDQQGVNMESFSTYGSVENPVYNLEDAFVLAKIKASEYQISIDVPVNILLMKGDHYVMYQGDSQAWFKQEWAQFGDNLNYRIQMGPLRCSLSPNAISSSHCLADGDTATQVTVYNKKGNSLRFDVTSSFTMTQIVIDSLDSLLHHRSPASGPLPDCLYQMRQCCQVDPAAVSGVSNLLASDLATFDCADSFRRFEESMEADCSVNWPHSLFRMRVQETDSPTITGPNELILENSEVRNVFMRMNSLVALAGHGGKITIQNSTFQTLSICGSTIKNQFSEIGEPLIKDVTNSNLITDQQMAILDKIRAYEIQASGPRLTSTQMYSGVVSSSKATQLCSQTSSKCTQIVIKTSTFQNIPALKPLQNQNMLVSSANGMKYVGSVLTLVNVQASITIQDSQFIGLELPYDGCSLVDNFLENTQVQPAISKINNEKAFHNPMSSYSEPQIEGLILVRDFAGPFAFIGNTVQNNVSLQGVLSVYQKSGPLVIHGNTFTKNTALVDSSTLTIRQNIPGSANSSQCGGILIQDNTFTNNIGCKYSSGPILVQCVQASGWQYKPKIDTYQYPLTQTMGNYQGSTTQDFIAEVQNLQLGISTITEILGNKIYLLTNTLRENSAGFERSHIQIDGFDQVEFGSVLENNENYDPRIYKSQSQLYQKQTSKTTPTEWSSVNDISVRALSPVSIRGASIINLLDCKFSNNYVLDDLGPALQIPFQSNGLLILDMLSGGRIRMKTVQFTQNFGVMGSQRVSILAQNGIKSNIFSIQRSQLGSLEFADVTFSRNLGATQTENEYGSINPHLFDLDQSQFQSSIANFTSTNLVLESNIFEGSKCISKFSLDRLQLSSTTIQANSGNSVVCFEFKSDLAQIQLDTLSVSSNSVNRGAVIHAIESEDFVVSGGAPSISTVNGISSAFYNFAINSASLTSNVGAVSNDVSESGPITSCLLFEGTTANWMRVQLSALTFELNSGAITNDLYFDESVSLLILDTIGWKAITTGLSQTKLAQFLYKSAQSSTTIQISNSQFTCEGVNYDEDVILEMNIEQIRGRASLFNLGDSRNSEIIEVIETEVVGSSSSGLEKGLRSPFTFPIQMFQNRFVNCQHMYKGAIYHIQQGGRVYDRQSTYGSSSALYGGVAFVTGDGSYLEIESPQEKLINVRAYHGGLFYIEDGGTVLLQKNIDISFCQAFEGVIAYANMRGRFIMRYDVVVKAIKIEKRGLFTILNGSQAWVKDIGTLKLSTAKVDSALFYFENNRISQHLIDNSNSLSASVNYDKISYFQNSNIQLITVEKNGRLISVLNSALQMKNIQFQNNEVTTDTYGVHASYSELEIIDCIFRGPDDSQIYTRIYQPDYYDVNGGFIAAFDRTQLTIQGSTFSGGRANNGGCLFLVGNSQATIRDSSFMRCAAVAGGAIYANGVNQMEIDNCSFTSNLVFGGYGQNVYAGLVSQRLILKDSKFSSYHNSVYSSGFQIAVTGCIFEGDGKNRATVGNLSYRSNGGALFIEKTSKVTIYGKTEFRSLRGRYGGAIYLVQDRVSTNALNSLQRSSPQTEQYQVRDVIFDNCGAEFDGGALFALNPISLKVQRSTFSFNSAAKEGGAIMYECEASEQDLRASRNRPCRLQITQNQFADNEAQIGGAVRWTFLPVLVSGSNDLVVGESGLISWGSNTLENNRAEIYGPEVAGIARELIRFDNEETYLQYYNQTNPLRQELVPIEQRSTFFNEYLFEGVQSGGSVPTVYFGLIDMYGQIVQTNKGSKIEFALSTDPLSTGIFRTEITGVTDFYSAFGTYKMSGMGILTEPGAKIPVTLTIDAIDLTNPSNKAFLTKQLGEKLEYTLKMRMEVQLCKLGEGLLPSGACFTCPKGTFLLEAPTEPRECDVCQKDKATCEGSYLIGPMPGFWRKSEKSNAFFPCLNKNACLGFKPELPFTTPGNPVGLCNVEEGYSGVLCSSCLPTFKAEGLSNCVKCSVYENYYLAGIFLFLTVGLCVTIRGTLKGAVAKQNTNSVFTKILMNHMQMLLITADFDMDWPDQVSSIFQLALPIKELTDAFVSFDCLMDQRQYDDVDVYNFRLPPDEIRVWAQKTIIMALLPILFSIFAYGIWWIICRWRRKLDELHTKFIATLVLLLFLIHPALTKRMVDVFNCADYDGVSRLKVDLMTVCYEDPMHQYMMYYVAGPSLFIWSLGIPATVFVLMNKEKDKLSTTMVKQKFGFLYNGYKRHNFFWEIVIMYRKIICIFIAVFLAPFGIIVQALVLFVLLGVFLQANTQQRPFLARQLNDIEGLSLSTQIITIYCGIFFVSNKPRDSNFNVNKDFHLPPEGQFFFFIIIATCNILFIFLWIFKFLEIGRDLIKSKFPKLYVFIFLCGRWDKYETENAKRASVNKKEKIIANMEETILYLNKIKSMYANNIFYQDHNRFLRLLYYIETERRQIDLTEKRHNYYIQGPRARHRKFDKDRMKELGKDLQLHIEADVASIMEKQREGVKDGKLSQSPYLDSLAKLKQLAQQGSPGDLQSQSSMDARSRRMTRLMSSMDPRMMSSGGPLGAFKIQSMHQGRGSAAGSGSSPNGFSPIKLMPTSNKFAHQMTSDNNMLPIKEMESDGQSQSLSPAPQTNLGSSDTDNENKRTQIMGGGGVAARENSFVGSEDAPILPNIHDNFAARFASQNSYFDVMEFGDEFDEQDEDPSMTKLPKKSLLENKKRKKRPMQADLEGMVVKSRNQKSQLRKDKKLRVIDDTVKVGGLPDIVLPDFLRGFPDYHKANKNKLSTKKGIDQSPDDDVQSIDDKLYKVRQLTARYMAGKEDGDDKPQPIPQLNSQMMQSGDGTSNVDGQSFLGGGTGTHTPLEPPSPAGSVQINNQSNKFVDIVAATPREQQTLLVPGQLPDDHRLMTPQKMNQIGKHDENNQSLGGKKSSPLKSDGSSFRDRLEEFQEDDKVLEGRKRMRPRNMPRRILVGDSVIDTNLDRSDSFKEMEQALINSEDKASLAGGQQLGSESSLRLGSDSSKWGGPFQLMNEEQMKRQLDAHDQLQISIINESGDIILPKLKTSQEQISSQNSQSSKKANRKQTDSKTSSLHTDSSMRDYDYTLEPGFSFHMPLSQKSIGDENEPNDGQMQDNTNANLGAAQRSRNNKNGVSSNAADQKSSLRSGSGSGVGQGLNSGQPSLSHTKKSSLPQSKKPKQINNTTNSSSLLGSGKEARQLFADDQNEKVNKSSSVTNNNEDEEASQVLQPSRLRFSRKIRLDDIDEEDPMMESQQPAPILKKAKGKVDL